MCDSGLGRTFFLFLKNRLKFSTFPFHFMISFDLRRSNLFIRRTYR